MNRKKIILIFLLLAVAAGTWYGYREYNRTNKDYSNVKPNFTISAADLIKEYENNDSMAARKYNGKSIEVNGNIKAIEKDEKGFYTIILGDSVDLSSVRCAMDTVHATDASSLTEGASAAIRGACTGFNKDEMGLGSDVIMNYCVIIKRKE